MGAQEKKSVKRHRRHNLKERFEILKTLGQGTYGKVKLAIEKSTKTKYAIKSIRKNKIETEQDLTRVRREIEIMATLSHPNITTVHEVFENKDRIVLVIEYAEGGELYDYINERQGLDELEARKFFRQITAAVHYLHSNGVVHRDLKLENILLDGQGNVKIADFGLSNVYGDNKLLSTFCGSPLYASPEIVNGQPYRGPEVDCWSLGVVLYTLVYGAMPFDGSDFKKLKHQITHGDYFEPRNPSDASGLIRQLLCTSVPGRATVDDICNHWWVNFGYDHSPAQIHTQNSSVDQHQLHHALKIPYSSDSETEHMVASASAIETTHINSSVVASVVTDATNTTAVINTQEQSINSATSPSDICALPTASYNSHNVNTSQNQQPVPLKGILKKPRSERPRRNSQGSADLEGASKNISEKKRRPQSDCFVDATWLHLVPDSEINTNDLLAPTKPVFDSTKKPKRGILKNKNSNGAMNTNGNGGGSANGSVSTSEHSRSDSGCVIDEQLNIYSALENFGQVSLPYKVRENQRDSAYGGDSRKPSCDSEGAALESNIYGFAEIDNVLDQIANFDVDNANNTHGNNIKCSSIGSAGDLSPFSRPESAEFEPTPSTSGELLDMDSSKTTEEPIRYRRKPLKSILKRKSKQSWRHSLGSQGSNSSADILDFSYDSCDGDHFMHEYCTVPIPLHDDNVVGDNSGLMQQEKASREKWEQFQVLPWQNLPPAPLNDTTQMAENGENGSDGSLSGKSIEHLVQVVEKLESDTNKLSGSRSNSDTEAEQVTLHVSETETGDDFHDYANVPSLCDVTSYDTEAAPNVEQNVAQETATNGTVEKELNVKTELPPPPLPVRPPPIGAPASPPENVEPSPPPLPETPPPPFKTHELDLFEFDMLEFEQSAADLCTSTSTSGGDSLAEFPVDDVIVSDVCLQEAEEKPVNDNLDVPDKEKHRLSDLIADLQECAQGSEAPAEMPNSAEGESLQLRLNDSDLEWLNKTAVVEKRSRVRRQLSVPTDLLCNVDTGMDTLTVDKTVPDELASPEFLHCIDVYNLEVASYFNNETRTNDTLQKAVFALQQHTSESSSDSEIDQSNTSLISRSIRLSSDSSESSTSSESDVIVSGGGELPQLFIEEETLGDVTNFDDVSTWLIEPGAGEEISETQLEIIPYQETIDYSCLQNGDICKENFDTIRDDVFTPIQQTKCSLDDIMRRIDMLGAKIDTELQSSYASNSKLESPFVDRNEAADVCRQALAICQKLN